MISQQVFDDKTIQNLKATDYLSRKYNNKFNETISLYIGFHNGGKNSGPIHSPKQCLPSNGWLKISSQSNVFSLPNGHQINLVSAVYKKGIQYQLFMYWYQVNEQSISSEINLKLAELLNAIRYNRRDSAFIRVGVTFDDNLPVARRSAEHFITDAYSLIAEHLRTPSSALK